MTHFSESESEISLVFSSLVEDTETAMSTQSYYSDEVRRILERDSSLPPTLVVGENEKPREEIQDDTNRKLTGAEYVELNTLSFCLEQRRGVRLRLETVV